MNAHRQLRRDRGGVQHQHVESLLPAFGPVAQVVSVAVPFQHRAAKHDRQAGNGQRHAPVEIPCLPGGTSGLGGGIGPKGQPPCQPQPHGGRPSRPGAGPQREPQRQPRPCRRIQRPAAEPGFPFGHFIGQVGGQHEAPGPARRQKQALAEQKDGARAAETDCDDPVAHDFHSTGGASPAKGLFSGKARHQAAISAPGAHQGFCAARRSSRRS